jgi:hypothetical protein
MLTPGTFVHVRVNPRRNRPLSIQPTEPPPVAPRLAAVLAARQQAGQNGLSDPAVLVTEQEAADVFGCPVRGTRLDLLGRLVIWRPAAASRPSLQVMVQSGALGARMARQAARHGTPLPAADGWLLSSRSAVLHAGTLTARVTLTDLAPAAAEAAPSNRIDLQRASQTGHSLLPKAGCGEFVTEAVSAAARHQGWVPESTRVSGLAGVFGLPVTPEGPPSAVAQGAG